MHGLEQHGDAIGIVAAVEHVRRDRLAPEELGLDQRVGERGAVAALGGSGRGVGDTPITLGKATLFRDFGLREVGPVAPFSPLPVVNEVR